MAHLIISALPPSIFLIISPAPLLVYLFILTTLLFNYLTTHHLNYSITPSLRFSHSPLLRFIVFHHPSSITPSSVINGLGPGPPHGTNF